MRPNHFQSALILIYLINKNFTGFYKMKKLYHKNFIILVAGQIISLLGSSIQRFSLSLYILDLTGSASIFAGIIAISVVPIFLIAPIAGVLSDRGNKKNLMISLDILSGIILIIYTFLINISKYQIPIIAAVMILLSIISTIYQPVVNTTIAIIVHKDNIIRANAIIQQVSSLTNFIGPILAGILYGFFGIKIVIAINIVSFFASAIMEFFLSVPSLKYNKTNLFKNVFILDIKESYYYLKNKNIIVFKMMIFAGLFNLFLVPVFSVLTPYLIKITLRLSSQAYGIAEGLIALGMIIGGVIITLRPNIFTVKKVHKLLYIVSISILTMGINILLLQKLVLSNLISFGILILSGMIIMGMLGIANVITSSYIYSSVNKNLLGKILSFGSAFSTICVPIGQIIFGMLVEVYINNLYIILYFSSIFVFLVTLLVRKNVLNIKK